MAGVDTRFKRASAMALVMPFIHTVHTDGTIGADAEERWAVTWMYIGISLSPTALGQGRPQGLLLGVYP